MTLAKWYADAWIDERGISASSLVVASIVSQGLRDGDPVAKTVRIMRREFPPTTREDWEDLVITLGTAFHSARSLHAHRQNPFVAALRFSAEGTRLTEVCKALDGLSVLMTDPALESLIPPFHWGCSTCIIPLTKLNLKNEKQNREAITARRLGPNVLPFGNILEPPVETW